MAIITEGGGREDGEGGEGGQEKAEEEEEGGVEEVEEAEEEQQLGVCCGLPGYLGQPAVTIPVLSVRVTRCVWL